MTVDVELLLAWHPRLILLRESCVEGFYRGSVLTAIGGSGGNIHPFLTVEYTGNKLAYEKRGWEVAIHDKADVLSFAAYKAAADVVAGVPKIDVYVVSHFACRLKGMLDQNFTEPLPLMFG